MATFPKQYSEKGKCNLLVQHVSEWYAFYTNYVNVQCKSNETTKCAFHERLRLIIRQGQWHPCLNFLIVSAHWFKLLCSRNRYCRHFSFKNMIILSMYLYTSDERHAWFHLYGTSWPVMSASKATNAKWKILAHSGTLSQNLEISSPMLTDWATRDLIKLPYLNYLYTYMYFRYQCIHWYKLENDDEERILCCTRVVRKVRGHFQ